MIHLSGLQSTVDRGAKVGLNLRCCDGGDAQTCEEAREARVNSKNPPTHENSPTAARRHAAPKTRKISPNPPTK